MATTPTGYWTNGTVGANGVMGTGTFVQGTPPASYQQQVSNTLSGTVNTNGTTNTGTTYNPANNSYTPTTTPVVTSQTAQQDFQQKQAFFNNLQLQQQNQATNLAQQQAVEAQNKSNQAQVDQANKVQQQQLAQKQQEIDAKNQALGLASGTQNTQQNNQQNTQQNQNGSAQYPASTFQNNSSQNTQNGQVQGPDVVQNGLNQATNTLTSGLQDIQSAKEQITQQAQGSLNQLLQGTFPLSAPQQALVNSLQNQLSQNVAQQQIANQSYVGQVTEVAFRSGGEYTSQQMSGQIANAISYGVSKVQALDNSAAQTMATLQQQFQTQNYDLINKNYDMLTKQLDDKSNSLKEMYSAVTKQLVDQRDYQLNVDKFNQTKDQNAFDNAFKIEQQQFDEKYKNKQQKIDEFKAGMGAGTNNGIGNGITATQMGADGKPDQASQKMTYNQIAQTYGPMTAVAIQGLADYSRLPSDWKAGSTKGMTRDQAVTLAQMLDPTYTEAGAPARQAYMKSIASNTGGSIGSAVNSANKSINHLTAFVNSMSKIGNTDPWDSSNALAQTIKTPFSPGLQQNINAAKTEGLGVADELAKFFKGTGSTNESEINAWKQQLSTNASPEKVKGLTQGAITLLAGQLETLSEQYKSTMGKAPDSNFIGPSAMANLSNLKNQGYQVDIPGVYYTDVNAYVNSAPENKSELDSVHSQYPELTPTQALQLAQYNQGQ